MKSYGTSKKVGLPPGSLVHVGKRKRDAINISTLIYNHETLNEQIFESIDELKEINSPQTITWINVSGLHDINVIEAVGKHFNISSLVLEDILNTNQRPKIEEYNDYIYIVLDMIYSTTENLILTEQISLILGKNLVITFQENGKDVFDAIRDRIKTNNGRIRKSNADYLMYSLLDAIVDNYFIIIEHLGEKIESTEEELIEKPTPETMKVIYGLKREMLFLHRSIWSLRGVVSTLLKSEIILIHKDTGIFLRDVYDHVLQVMDTVEIYRDILSEMIDIYLSSTSNKMNEVMKVLTVISTIFMPLTFIVGVYGMNFKYMPELDWKWSYFITWIIMCFIGIIMFIYFKKRKWI